MMCYIKSPFGFELATVAVNDSVTRETITKEQMRGCGLILQDVDFETKFLTSATSSTGLRI